jgi:hypothetical protein
MFRKRTAFAISLLASGMLPLVPTQADEETLPEVNPPRRITCSPNRVGVFIGKVYVTCAEHDGPDHVAWFNLDFSDKEFVNRALVTINTALVAGKGLTFDTRAPDGYGSDWRLVKGIDMSQ